MQGHLIRTVYNFIENNDLSVANFIYDQKVNFTFSNVNTRTYIDNNLISRRIYVGALYTVRSDDEFNASDHFTICMSLTIVTNSGAYHPWGCPTPVGYEGRVAGSLRPIATVCSVEWNVNDASFTPPPKNGAIVRTDSVRTKAYLQNSETCMRNLHC